MQKILLLEDDVALGNGIRLAPQGPHAFSYCEDLTFTVEQGSFADRYCEKMDYRCNYSNFIRQAEIIGVSALILRGKGEEK